MRAEHRPAVRVMLGERMTTEKWSKGAMKLEKGIMLSEEEAREKCKY